ncbi:hypothetical protein CHGG_03260 [Chaetomium globosum CBS 148.51]|uniref:PHD-type domain-containing protein n=1 Tax=Chaetomium globosum (strain ATCC 6205 / CBS 148.51 / DSM 1962 / NBRC 6347 / NRRL 1970) TaxID=306901 RepID=Q2H944_CHAGB|nr:uncharacterized protein CHGG_03260 [Chaetomium globosum CBS 148.51]EAQ91325.1 hypothetical protein CHGG_03260 [Chaetomium globosum CBS 148.51]
MPANNTTVSANTRATRSRFSSPQTAANGATTDSSSRLQGASGGNSTGNSSTTNGAEGSKTLLQRWLEPPVQVKASYQDAGLVRQGVFENMAPLGTLPKVGLFRKTAPPPPAATAPAPAPAQRAPVRIVIKQRKPALPSTPAPAPPPAPEEDETEADETVDEDDGKTEDQDEERLFPADKEHHKARTTAASQRSRRSVTSLETDYQGWTPSTSAQNGRSRRSISRASSGPLQQLPTGTNDGLRPFVQRESIGKVVEAAIEDALTHFRYPTAWALRTLYKEKSSEQEFLTMIEKVARQTANADELEQFARCILAKKKEGKKDNQAFFNFEPSTTGGAASSAPQKPQKPKKAPYGNLVKFGISSLRLDQDGSEPRKRRERTVDTALDSESVPAPAPEPERAAKPQESEPELEPEIEPEPEPEPEPELKPEPEPEPEFQLPPRKKRKSGRQQSEATASSSSKMASNGTNVKRNPETPPRRRTRARSESSLSSLSSVRSLTPPVDETREDGEEDQGFDEAPPSRTSPAPAVQPITANKRRRSNAPRKSRNVSPSRPSPVASNSTAPQRPAAAVLPSQPPQPTQRQSPAAEQPAVHDEQQPYEMPAVVDSPLFPNFNSKKGGKSGTPSLVLATKLGKIDPEDPNLRHRQEARRVTNTAFPVSDVRGGSPQAASKQANLEEQTRTATPATPATVPASRPRATLPSARATPAPREGRSTRSSLKRTHDDLEDQPSPTATNFPGSEAASAAADSRAGTPALRAVKKPRAGLRVKNSPMKKKHAPSAGIPRLSGERSSPVGNAPREDDNDDYCTSCGGNGQLICCDGCTRSFHFICVDPVLSNEAMTVEFFCNVCRVSRDPARLPTHGGIFAVMLEKLDASNSSAFRLPAPIRDLFEGVRTGPDGEYEEIVNVVKPPARKKKSEEDQLPDLHRLRDAKGNVIICQNCRKSAGPDRALIPCSACGLFWHMDCLEVPLASPPSLRTWKCPLHTDSLLGALPVHHPGHKYRKLKNAPVITPTFTRGYVNNGFIEVDLDDSDDESGWRDVETFGRTVRLSERGIKLDFISRRQPLGRHRRNHRHPPVPRPMEQRSVEELQAALNLAQLSVARDDNVATLINAMISQADPLTIDVMARANATQLESTQLDHMDQQSLRAMLANAESMANHIRRLLASSTSEQPAPRAMGAKADAEQTSTMTPSLANSQSPDPDSDNSANLTTGPSAMEIDAAKSPPSPATTDDVPAMTQGEKTPIQGDQSPAAPLPLEQTAPIESGGVPATPTKVAALPGDEPLVLEAGGDAEKTLGEACEGGSMEME